MNRDQLENVMRASAAISGETSFVLIGSQAVLLALADPDPFLTRSDEIDLYPAMAPEKSDAIDEAIGALSRFHDEFGYHADGVSPETAVLPPDWMSRATFHYFGESRDLTAICPELHDLCVSKCAAGRDKAADFVRVLMQQGHIVIERLHQRILKLDGDRYPVASIAAWAQRRYNESQGSLPP